MGPYSERYTRIGCNSLLCVSCFSVSCILFRTACELCTVHVNLGDGFEQETFFSQK